MNISEKIHIDAFLYAVYAAIIPINMIMNYSGKATVNKQIGIIAVIAMLLFIILQHKYMFLYNPNKGLIVFIIYSLFSLVWSVSFTDSIAALTTLFSLLFIYLIGKLRAFNSKEVLIISICMIALASAIPFFLGINKAVSYSRGTLMNENGAADHNGLACNLVFGAILALDKFFSIKKRFFKYVFAAGTGLIIIAIFITGSRSAIIALGVSVIYYLIKSFPKLKGSRSFWGTIILTVVAFVAVYYYLENHLHSAVIKRLGLVAILYGRGNGRIDIWKNILKIIGDNPIRALFGWGYGTQKVVYASYYGIRDAAHNVFLQLWLDVGIIGMAAFLAGIMKFWKDANYYHVYVSNALWLALFITFMTLSFSTNKGAWNVFLLMYLFTLHQSESQEPKRSKST